MGRPLERIAWLKKLSAIWKALEATDTVLGWWDRVPRAVRHLIGFGLSWLFITFGLRVASAGFDYGTENWPAAVLAGLALAAVLWGVIEALRFHSMQGAAYKLSIERDVPRPENVLSSGGRVSVTEDIDGKYLRLKVTNIGHREEEFEVKFDKFHGTGEEETAYNARWRATRDSFRRLKAGDFDYINVAECLGPTGTGTSKLRFFTADLPVGKDISHHFERDIPLGYATSWMFEVHAEPPLASPMRKSCMIDIGKDGWVKRFAIDPDFGGFTGPAMQIS